MSNTCEELIKKIRELQHYDENGDERADGPFLLADDVEFTIDQHKEKRLIG